MSAATASANTAPADTLSAKTVSANTVSATPADEGLRELLDQRIVVLDGAWGTLLQDAGLTAADYRDDRLRDHPRDVTGDPDLLNLTRPDVVLDAHRRYLAAGADITTTNTFTATSIGQADYGLQGLVPEMNLRGAQLARQAADEVGGRFVAGSIGPMNVTLSLSPDVDDPAYRAVNYDAVYASYAEQVRALAEGGVDLLLIETIFDTLNAKAAIAAARAEAPHLPLWISVTVVDLSGRTLSGQTVEAFWRSVEHAEPLVVGVNCSLGAREIRPHVDELSRLAGTYTACHPNAGLPNAFGGYDQHPDETARLVGEFAAAGMVNVVGGCCGTTPDHISRIAATVAGLAPRPVPALAAPIPVQRPGAVRDRPRHRVRHDRGAHQRHRLAAVPPADRVGRPPGRRGRRAGAGARRGQPARRQHGRRPARQRAGHDHVPEPDRDRAGGRPHPGHDRQLAVERAPGRAQVRAGQGRGQLDQPQGGRGVLPGAGPADPRARRRGGRDGLRRAGPGRHRGAQGGHLRPGLRPARAAGRLRARGHHLRPQRAGRGHRHRRAQRLRQGVHRRAAADQAALPRRAHQRRHLQPVVRVPRQRRGPRGHALGVPVPRRAGRAGHGHRQRRPARGLPGHPGRAAGAGRGRAVRPAAGRHRPAGDVRGHGDRAGHRPHRGPVLA